MSEMIKTTKLTYSILDTNIIKDISLKVQNKQMVGIIGPNGSGKTTLLKHIYRALIPEKNTVFIKEKPIETYSYKDCAKELSVVKQENTSDFEFTVKEIVLLGRAPYHNYFESYTKTDEILVDNALKTVGMLPYADRLFNELSGGEKQRVLIARSLAQNVEILLLDEPTNHLDVYYQWNLMEFIKRLNCTVLGVFHELNLAASVCDYIYVLHKGQIYAHGRPRVVFTKELIAEIFGVQSEVIWDGEKTHILIKGAISE